MPPSVVTTTLIIGYEVAATKIGIAAAASNGQEFLPIYLLGPYRLATVVAGLVVSAMYSSPFLCANMVRSLLSLPSYPFPFPSTRYCVKMLAAPYTFLQIITVWCTKRSEHVSGTSKATHPIRRAWEPASQNSGRRFSPNNFSC